jgi:bifunctional non-homologous end joining protein LigD
MSVATLSGLKVLLTGTVPSMDRTKAKQFLSDAGAHVAGGLAQDLDLIIFGAKPGGKKLEFASAHGIKTITWSDAVALASGAAVQSTAPPASAATINQPPKPNPDYRQVFPMLAKKHDGLPSGGEWYWEIKWDGYRAVAHINGETQLASRAGLDFNERFPHIVAILDRVNFRCILDGEIVVLDEQGRSDYSRLQKGDTAAAVFVVFDVLAVLMAAKGSLQDTRPMPLRERRVLLEEIVAMIGSPFVQQSPLLDSGEEALETAQILKLEGIVAKKPGSPYKEGSRAGSWLKIKLREGQEFVVVGYTAGEGARSGTAGGFLVATWDGLTCEWLYHGTVGSGGTYEEIEAIRASLTPLTGPNAVKHNLSGAPLRKVTWVAPEVVVQVEFQRWTDGDKLFHPSLKGVRNDKTPLEVVRET